MLAIAGPQGSPKDPERKLSRGWQKKGKKEGPDVAWCVSRSTRSKSTVGSRAVEKRVNRRDKPRSQKEPGPEREHEQGVKGGKGGKGRTRGRCRGVKGPSSGKKRQEGDGK